MKLIDPFFKKLRPQIDHLSHEVIMAQAWKKTHAYMRTHNWYADTLGLDISALGLEHNVKDWAEQVKASATFLHPMELVPAAKSEEWVIDKRKGWIPKSAAEHECEFQTDCLGYKTEKCSKVSVRKADGKDKSAAEKRQEKPPLRPLAHLTVRDQTWATAAMLCLADVVESAQGDCSEPNVLIARAKKVYSYGNRLLCDWEDDDSARFRWGNSQTYRKFFTDYQKFLKRPVAVGREVALSQEGEDHVYVVSLDLEKFYDNVNRADLVSSLKKLCEAQEVEQCDDFWQVFAKITNWQWEDKAKSRANELNLKLNKEGCGLPQGLVASGFFANAFMVEFDQVVGKQIHQSIPGADGIILHDYCRYVDDLRLVVSIDDDDDLYEKIEISVNKWISKLLSGHGLKLNEDKTNITVLSDLDNSGTLSERIKQLQHELSGPADRDTLESSIGVLEGLLSTPVENLTVISPDQCLDSDIELIRLARFDHDVRTDTLKRFAANRLEMIMRNKRRMAEHLKSDAGGVLSSMDNESELVAKKLVWAWMKDPSLALVLRKAVEIYPSPSIIEPVLSAIYSRCSFIEKTIEDKVSSAIADYLLADMFRCCCDFYGFFQRMEYPLLADPEGVLSVAGQYAQRAMSEKGGLPDFVRKQALFLLAILQKPASLEYGVANRRETIQDSLHRILSGLQPVWHHQRFALYEVASQIINNPGVVAGLLLKAAEEQEPDEQVKLLDELAKRGGPFWECFWKKLKKSKISHKIIDKYKWAAPVLPMSLQKVPQRLLRLSVAPENPFVHECALIKLAQALLEALQSGELDLECSPGRIEVWQFRERKYWVKWSEIWRGEAELTCKRTSTKRKYPYDIRFELPDWLRDDDDVKALYWLGTILRSVVVGTDFTGNRWKKGKATGYKGLRTGWYKRRMGMMHAPEALVGDYATLSRWTSELLMKCLQWPGFEATHITHEDLKGFDRVETLGRVLKKRLEFLNGLYCKAADIPVLITRVDRSKSKKGKSFRMVAVQSLLPRSEFFSKSDPTLSCPEVKAVNRDHLARVCQLTYKTLLAKLQTEISSGEDQPVYSDLIVFPELAVHPEDQDILKRLADKTKSIVFAGLLYMKNEEELVNISRWIIPDYRQTGRQWMIRDQGKGNLTEDEVKLGVVGNRPCQHIIEVHGFSEGPLRLTGAICYDSTDLKLAADLKGKTDLFVVVAHNKDINTFDSMASALHYHMYQHVAVVNKGEYGGSSIQAPYKASYDRLISHVHGVGQISINIADLDLAAFRRDRRGFKGVKTPPANLDLFSLDVKK